MNTLPTILATHSQIAHSDTQKAQEMDTLYWDDNY